MALAAGPSRSLPLPESGHPGDQVALHDLEAAIQCGDPAAVVRHLADTGLECQLPVVGGPSPAMQAASLALPRVLGPLLEQGPMLPVRS